MRARHYSALVVVAGLLFLPNLGAHALWDMDEGVNAGCAKEMYEAGTWVVPVFNGELRVAKPALLYWLQITAFKLGGVSEWTARLPSALLGILTVLVTYELGRRMFDAITGLLAGIALASATQFSLLSHAATPDAPLLFFTTLAMLGVWVLHEDGGRDWLVWPAVACGLAVLSKGPIGVAGPGLALLLYFAWNRELRRLLDRKLVTGVLLGVLVIAPWVALVASETRGEWVTRFLRDENANRIATAQEHHSGPVVFYVGCILALFAPWSAVLGPTTRAAVRAALGRDAGADPRPLRFLLTWVVAYLVPFSLFATKLPNYIAPVYPPLAVLTAWWLVRWMRGETRLPGWAAAIGVAAVALTGVVFGVGFVVAGGVTPLMTPGDRIVPGLETWAWVGLIPVVAAAVMAWGVVRDRRDVAVVALAAAAVGLLGVIAAGPVLVIDRQKSAKILALTSGAARTDRDIRLGAAQYFQDSQSVVFYAGRRVERLDSEDQVREFLSLPGRYLFIPEPVWQGTFAGKPGTPPAREVARKYDLNRNAVVLVLTTDE